MLNRVLTFAALIGASLGIMADRGLAACPTRADLDEGVVLVQNTPFFARSDFETAGSSVFFRQRVSPPGWQHHHPERLFSPWAAEP